MHPTLRHGLPESALEPAQHLLSLCNETDRLDLPIEIEPDPADETPETAAWFRAYDHNDLIALAWLPREPEPEACLMVHPAHRRRGIGTSLLTAVQAEAGRRGLGDFLLICDEASPAVRPFVLAAGGVYQGAEHRLELDPAASDRSRPRIENLRLNPAGPDDLATLVQLRAAAFDTPPDYSDDHIQRGLADPRRAYYVATLDAEPIGILRLSRWGDVADVTSFGVLEARRGRGYGRQMLLDALDILLAEGWDRILIEVVTDNAAALGLYQSCGFRITATYGFYRVAV